MPDELQTAPKPKARDLNELVRYTMWSVFRVSDRAGLDPGERGNEAREVAVRCGVSTSLAFGGNDSALVMRTL